MVNRLLIPGSRWKCIDEDSNEFNQICTIVSANTDPDFNGDGEIELLYDNGLRHYGKVRRFVPGMTHTRIYE
jgi:hypothetical protein